MGKITRREFLKVSGFAAAGAVSAGIAANPLAAAALRSAVERENDAAAPAKTIVLIVTDDQDAGTLDATMPEGNGQVPVMRHLLSGRGGGWARFDGAVCNQAICAPSRASIITGLYAHNHGVEKNSFRFISQMPTRDHTLARWLGDAGWFCAFKGKYSYGKKDGNIAKPAGWDIWEPGGGLAAAVFPRGEQIIRQVSADTPLFLCLWPVDPHEEARPQPTYSGRTIVLPPDNPSVNEADVSDKPARIRGIRPLSSGALATLRDKRRQACRALAGVDDGIKRIMDALADKGRLDNAVIVFAGDHGYSWGEHRLTRKDNQYWSASGFPFLIRVPGAPDQRIDRLVSNVDIAPTLAALAGVAPDVPVDGRSLVPLITNPQTAGWREEVLIERNLPTTLNPVTYRGVYAVVDGKQYSYVAHETGEEELYDLSADPDQMASLHNSPAHAAIRRTLADKVDELW